MQNINRRVPNKSDPPTLSAEITIATVSIEAYCSPDVVPKLNLLALVSVGPTDESEEEPTFIHSKFEVELPVLSFSEQLLDMDGYAAVRLLRALKEQKDELWFCYGAFRSQNGKRHHIVLQAAQVPKCLAILDWEIKSWTKKRIHHF